MPLPFTSPHIQIDAEGVGGARAYRLKTFHERASKRRRLHHAAWAISSHDGSEGWSASFGDADDNGTPMRPETPFVIASVTKQFIAALALQAAERDELDLDAPITDYLPHSVTERLHVIDGVDHTPQITVRHLLTHTSGLPDYWDKPRDGASLYSAIARGDDQSWTFDDILQRVRTQHTPHFPPQDLREPRQKASYSDTGFQLLIAILEQVTGSPFGALIQDRICAPLGLEHTWLPGSTRLAASTAEHAGIYVGRTALHLPRMIESCNDLISTTGDLLTFHRALIGGNLFASAKSVETLTDRANLLRNAFPLRYGTGTMLFKVGRLAGPGKKRVTLIGHSGATGTWLFFCPQIGVHLAGTIDQAKGRQLPFRLMAQMLQAWHG